MTKILDSINSAKDIKKIPIKELPVLAREVRERIIDVVSKTGGHLASSLGAVELAVSLHYSFDMPKDKIIWDVGHQAYPHKILTGRNKNFDTLRQLGGISGFPLRGENECDIFTCGHSSTSISTALGLAAARDLKKENHKVIAIIGDSALANGMAFEALNHAGHLKKDIMVILNDNDLSISKSVGALSRYLNKIITSPGYNRAREQMQVLVKRIPIFGFKALRAAKRLEESLKNLLIPGVFFEELGFRYFGPIDGHDISGIISTFKNLSKLKEPVVLHVVTKKGKGYRFSEERPTGFHSAPPFNKETGEALVSGGEKNFTDVFSEKLVDIARENDKIVAITAAMPDGTGLDKFASEFSNRFFDVGIAEEHAVAFAAGLCEGGFKPIVAIYSTFLQRGYDQIIHDVSLQNLGVIFCIDRAGIVGEDGATHNGVFDIAYLRHVPNLVLMAPRDGLELEGMLKAALKFNKPVAIRYPKSKSSSHLPASTFKNIELGKAEILREGKDMAFFALGSMVSIAIKTADILSSRGIEATVVNARFAKPIDKETMEKVALRVKKIVTLEEGVVSGGFGSAVLEFMQEAGIKNVKTKIIGLPDQFISHGKREEIFKEFHLTTDEIAETVRKDLF